MSTGVTVISDKWVKASIIGTIWAAAEIVLGSFLHNLRVPFSGNVLTAIALVILISVSYRWREHGLYWRAGIICALMKTMSPSAVIFGPMIAIMMESLLLEITVRLFGMTYLGFIIGSMLAMSWNLFQKIFNLIIFYGGSLVDIYTSITDYASKQLDLRFDAFWAPLILLLGIYALFGGATAVAGIITGRRLVRLPKEELPSVAANTETSDQKKGQTFSYSLAWLAADIILIAGLLVIVSLAPWVWWIITVIPVITVLALRYKRAMRQLSKPGFWVMFVVITMLSALAFTAFQPGKNNLSGAVLIGIQMNFRAVIIIVGFSALGTELYNPKIRSLFSRSHLRQLPLALELSTASLPSMIADMPDFRTAVKHPVTILGRMISRVERRLEEVRKQPGRNRQVFIVSGEIGKGKTSLLGELVVKLRGMNIAVGGIIAPRIIENETTTGYDIIDISSGVRTPFLRLTNPEIMGIERFSLCEEGHTSGLNALDPEYNINKSVMIVDEAGPLELRGEGWSGRIMDLLDKTKACLIIVVRESLVEKVVAKFGLKDPVIFEAGDSLNRKAMVDILTGMIIKVLKNG